LDRSPDSCIDCRPHLRIWAHRGTLVNAMPRAHLGFLMSFCACSILFPLDDARKEAPTPSGDAAVVTDATMSSDGGSDSQGPARSRFLVWAGGFSAIDGATGKEKPAPDVFLAKIDTDGNVGAWTSGPALPAVADYNGSVVAFENRVVVIADHSRVFSATMMGDVLGEFTEGVPLSETAYPCAGVRNATLYVPAIDGSVVLQATFGATGLGGFARNQLGDTGVWEYSSTGVGAEGMLTMDKFGIVHTASFSGNVPNPWKRAADAGTDVRGIAYGAFFAPLLIDNGHAYVVGAITPSFQTTNRVYNASISGAGVTLPWIETEPFISTNRMRHSAIVVDGSILVVGGLGETMNTRSKILPTGALAPWDTSVPPLPAARGGHCRLAVVSSR
jgi:hypothetical protein